MTNTREPVPITEGNEDNEESISSSLTSFASVPALWVFAFFLAACLPFAIGCGQESVPVTAHVQPKPRTSSARIAGASAAKETACSGIKYGVPRALARVDDDRINESSGLTRSLAHPDRFWTHNDGNTPRLYCISKQGETVGLIKLEGAKFDDCEDIASFTRGGKNYLLLADAGDNDFNRREYRLHLLEEPTLQEDGKKKKKKRPQDVDVAMTIPFRFPDGPHDCEAVAVDPTSGKVYLATKEPARGTRVYELDLPAEPPQRPLTPKLVARLEISRTAAIDISPDGRRAVFSTDSYLYEFARKDNEDWTAALARQACRLPTPPRDNGESICYGADGKSLYLTSEGRNEPMWEIPAVE